MSTRKVMNNDSPTADQTRFVAVSSGRVRPSMGGPNIAAATPRTRPPSAVPAPPPRFRNNQDERAKEKLEKRGKRRIGISNRKNGIQKTSERRAKKDKNKLKKSNHFFSSSTTGLGAPTTFAPAPPLAFICPNPPACAGAGALAKHHCLTKA